MKIIEDNSSCINFSDRYPKLNEWLLGTGNRRKSRVGEVVEQYSVLTKIVNPYAACVGGWGRNINIFFLIAEAFWIWSGRRDVEFLKIFNSKMTDFSDDGKFFHAPYGWRLRNWGEASVKEHDDASLHGERGGLDQIFLALKMLNSDKDSRRVVMSIWNPILDLDRVSKDLPCNDLVMLKVFNDSLYMAIANRSNDLHWGLPTNVFQFSFIGQMISGILNLEYAEQSHFSHSLHAYLDNPIAERMMDNSRDLEYIGIGDLYNHSRVNLIDMNFTSPKWNDRLEQTDSVIDIIIDSLTSYYRNSNFVMSEMNQNYIKGFSKDFWVKYLLLKQYIDYKKSPDKSDSAKLFALNKLGKILTENGLDIWDMGLLAKNFFCARMDGSFGFEKNVLGKL